jgi:hypothetical protein
VGENKVRQNNLTSGAGITQSSVRHSHQIAAIKAKNVHQKIQSARDKPDREPSNSPASLLLTSDDPINSLGR